MAKGMASKMYTCSWLASLARLMDILAPVNLACMSHG